MQWIYQKREFALLLFILIFSSRQLVCQEVPEEPVLSPVSNHVFEKRLIVKYLQETGTDPINGEPLEEAQLLEIKGKPILSAKSVKNIHLASPLVKPRPPSATSIPAILKLLQDEWVRDKLINC